MNSFFRLVKIEGGNTSVQTDKTKKNKILMYIFSTFITVFIGIWLYFLSKDLINTLTEMGLSNFFITMIISGAFIFNLFTVITSSFIEILNNKTTNYLNTLPIDSKTRFLAVISANLKRSYSFTLLISVVPIIFFGINKGLGISYYFFSAIGLFLLPILPTLIFYTIMFFITNIIKLIFSKKALNFLNIILSIGLMYIYFKINAEATDSNFLVKLIEFSRNTSKNPLFWYPNQISNIITDTDRINSLVNLVFINSLTLLVLTFTLGNIYLKQILSFTDMGKGITIFNSIFSKLKKNKNKEQNENTLLKDGQMLLTKEELLKEQKIQKEKRTEVLSKLKKSNFKQQNKGYSFIKREWSFFFKNPTVAMNTIFGPLVFFIAMVVSIGFIFGKEATDLKKSKKIYLYRYMSNFEENYDDDEKEIIKSEDSGAKIFQLKVDGKEADYIQTYMIAPDNYFDKEITFIAELIEENKEIYEKHDLYNEKLLKIELDKIWNEDNTKEDEEQITNEYFKEIEKYFDQDNLSEEYKEIILKEMKEYDFVFMANLYNSNSGIDASFKVLLAMQEESNKNQQAEDELNKDNSGNISEFYIPLGISVGVTFFTLISIFMYSKEKDSLNFLKTMPLSEYKQFKYKRIPGLTVKGIFILLFMMLYLLIVGFKKIFTINGILGIIAAILFTLISETFQLYLDNRKPNLDWKTPEKLVKQTTKSFIVLITNTIVIIIVVALRYLLINKLEFINDYQYIYVLLGLLILITILLESFVKKNLSKMKKT